MGIFTWLHKRAEWAGTYITLYQFCGGATVVSFTAASTWAAMVTSWLNVYGPIAWIGSGLLGALVAVAVLFVMAAAKYMWVLAGATIKWQEQVSSINPLDTEFTKQRIKAVLQRHEELLELARDYIDSGVEKHQRQGDIRFLYGNIIEEYINTSCHCHPVFEWVDRGSVEDFIKWIEEKNK